MSKSTATTESTTAEVVKQPSRYEVHYARLRELQAERKQMRDAMLAKIAALKDEYKSYLAKYEAARQESEAQFKAAAKPKVTTKVPEVAEAAEVAEADEPVASEVVEPVAEMA